MGCEDFCLSKAQRVGSWPAVLQQALVNDAAIVRFTKSLFEYKIGDFGALTLLLFSI
jgi:hypothetical protein